MQEAAVSWPIPGFVIITTEIMDVVLGGQKGAALTVLERNGTKDIGNRPKMKSSRYDKAFVTSSTENVEIR